VQSIHQGICKVKLKFREQVADLSEKSEKLANSDVKFEESLVVLIVYCSAL